MTPQKKAAAALGVFGLAVIAGGFIRYMGGLGGEKGLYFGLVMGGIALTAALLAGLNRILAARVTGGIAIAFVVLWFCVELYKTLSGNFVIGGPEVRKLILVALGIVTAFVLSRPVNK